MSIGRQLRKRLTLKIGAVIILVEVFVLTVLGIVYVNRFSIQVDRRTDAQARLPGLLMNAGLLSFDSVADGKTMRKLVGEELVSGMVVGVNHTVFYALDPEYLGLNIADVPAVDAGFFDPGDPREVTFHEVDGVSAVSPVFAVDGRTPRFFVYVKVGIREAKAEKAAFAWLIILGTAAAVLLTASAIIWSFSRSIADRLRGPQTR